MKAPFPISWKRVWTILVYSVALLGAWVLFSLFLAKSCSFLFVTERTGSLASPNGQLKAVREVTRGGFGTVWTTRLFLVDRSASNRIMIYKNSDSDFVPKWRWAGPEQLLVMVPCGRTDFMASPAGYSKASDPIGRVRVQFVYDWAACAQEPQGDL